jgi:hypothetical protein
MPEAESRDTACGCGFAEPLGSIVAGVKVAAAVQCSTNRYALVVSTCSKYANVRSLRLRTEISF